MARLRTLKPGFFTNDLLAEVPPLGRLLFQGLWCIADREGRLEDRPRKIKAEVLPYDDCDVDDLLATLAHHGFVVRYAVDGQRYVQIVNFLKHQNPHYQERPSEIPPPPGHVASAFVAPDDDPTVNDPPLSNEEPLAGDAAMVSASSADGQLMIAESSADDGWTSRACLVLGPMNGHRSGHRKHVVREAYSSGFEAGWLAYPRKLNKHGAWIQWQRLIRAGEDEARLIAACRHLAEYVEREGTEDRFVPHGATFFGQQRKWEDYVAGVPAGGGRRPMPKSWAALAAVRDHMEQGA